MQTTKIIPAYLINGKSIEIIKMGMMKAGLGVLINSKNNKIRIKSREINNGSDIKLENVSTISGEIARIIEAIKLVLRLAVARKLINPIMKILIEKSIMSDHLTVKMKLPPIGVIRLRKKGKNGGNSVIGVFEPFEFRIIAPFPARIFRAALI